MRKTGKVFSHITLLFALLAAGKAVAADDPAAVLILCNETFPPEEGTGAAGASVFVAEHYAARRSIPTENILRLRIPLSDPTPQALANENIRWEDFSRLIRSPVREWLKRVPQGKRIRYIVPVYGIPVRVPGPPSAQADGLSVDSYLASIESDAVLPWLPNPYGISTAGAQRMPFRHWTNPGGWRMFLVTRLDGPSAAISAHLVDRAIDAERDLRRDSGFGYFDYRRLPCCTDLSTMDQTILSAYRFSTAKQFESVLNDQSLSGYLLRNAPRALWVLAWYSVDRVFPGYHFVNGAVGAHLASFTAETLRTVDRGSWVPHWLQEGITATWGATAEPYTRGYARGDILLERFWSGSSFAESAYLATPFLNWKMVFVGDPLYSPEIFRSTDHTPPHLDAIRVESTPSPFEGLRNVTISWHTDEPSDTGIYYHLDRDTPAEIRFDSTLTTAHSVAVRDLPIERALYFRITSRDISGNLAESAEEMEGTTLPTAQ